MASVKRNQYEAAFKAWVALGAVKGEKPVAQIASKYGYIITRYVSGRNICSMYYPAYF